MEKDIFVQNVKKLCAQKNVKPTNACKECGVGGSFLSDINRGQVPSVEKVQTLAHHLGVTTSELLGELPAAGSNQLLTDDELQLLQIYRSLLPEDRHRALGVLEGIISGYTQTAGDGGEKRLA